VGVREDGTEKWEERLDIGSRTRSRAIREIG
jgi:hypothetical protein